MKPILPLLVLLCLAPFARAADPVPTGGLSVNLGTGALIAPKGPGSISLADPAFGGQLPDARLSALAESSAQRTAALLVDSARGNDTTAVRGTTLPYATLAAAMAAYQAGDTIQLAAGSYSITGDTTFSQPVTIRGSGAGSTNIQVSTASRWVFGPGATLALSDLTFSSSTPAATPTTDAHPGSGLIHLGSTSGNRLSHLVFLGVPTTCIAGFGLSNSVFSDITVSHCFQGLGFNDGGAGPPNAGGNLFFDHLHITFTAGTGLAVHDNGNNTQVAISGYTGLTVPAPGLAAGLFITNSDIECASGPALEVEYGWSNIHIGTTHVADSPVGFTIANCTNITLETCTSNGCGSLYEFDNDVGVTANGCIADGRSAADSLSASPNTTGAGTNVLIDGCTKAINWNGGQIIATTYHPYGYAPPCEGGTVTGATFLGAFVYNQHSSHTVIQDCTIEPLNGTQPANYMIVDGSAYDGSPSTAFAEIHFLRNHLNGGSNGAGILCQNGGSVDDFVIEGNYSDGTYINNGYLATGTTTLTHTKYANNRSLGVNAAYPLNVNFPNDDDPTNASNLASGTVPVALLPGGSIVNSINGQTGAVTLPGAGGAASTGALEPVVTHSANYTFTNADANQLHIFANSPVGVATATLTAPTSTAFVNGWSTTLKNLNSAPLTVAPPAGTTIDTLASLVLPPNTVATVVSDGTNYRTSNVSYIANPAQNLVLASPNGASGVPSFRSLVAADLPNTINPSSIGATTPGTGAFTNVSASNITSPNGPLEVGGSGNGTLSLRGGVSYGGGIKLLTVDGLTIGLFDGQTGSLTLDRTGAGNGNLTMTGSLSTGGTITNGASGTPVALHRVITGTLSAGTVTLSDPNITTASRCEPTNEPSGYTGAIGVPYVSAQAAGTVTITSSNAAAANPISVIIEN